MCDERDKLKQHLDELVVDGYHWRILYRDRRNGQFWEETYPQSHLHGGGPPELSPISAEEVRQRYGPLPA